jgi:hypothetical protein
MSFRIWGAVVLIVLGVLFWLGKFGIIDFYWDRDWPVILIAIGVFSLVNHFTRSRRRGNRRKKIKILSELDDGKIDAEEAIDELKKM